MQNAKQITTIAVLIAITSSIATYAFTSQNDPFTLIEAENKKAIRECLSAIDYESWTTEIQKATTACGKLELKRIVDPSILNATGSKVPEPPKGYTTKHSLILTWSHSYVKYSDRIWASWKNNNSAWLTWWVSDTLKGLWNDAWIRYKKALYDLQKRKATIYTLKQLKRGYGLK